MISRAERGFVALIVAVGALEPEHGHLHVGLLAEDALLDRESEHVGGQPLDLGRHVDQLRVARLERPFRAFELGQVVEVGEQSVGHRTQRVARAGRGILGHRWASSWRLGRQPPSR